MKKLLVCITVCICLTSCDFLRDVLDFTERLGDGGRTPDTPYVNDYVSMDKVYNFRVNNDLLKVANITFTILNAAGELESILVTGTSTISRREKVDLNPVTRACKLTPEETELAASVTCEPKDGIPAGQYVFEYELQMNYVVTRENGQVETIYVVNSQPQCPCVEAEDVPNELHAISLGCTKDMQFNQDNGYINNNTYWVTSNQGYINWEVRPTDDGLNQTDPATQPQRRAGREYVDLGLSVYWATCNVGARTESEYGGVYGWADGSGYHTEASYKFYPTSRPSVKNIAGTRMDIAHCQWGDGWKMPSTAELGELFNRDNCNWEWTDSYKSSGIKGYVVTSRKAGYEGNYIFLPAGGKRQYETYYQQLGQYGYYWSSELYDGDNQFAYIAYFTSKDNLYPKFHLERYNGAAVRPVYPK